MPRETFGFFTFRSTILAAVAAVAAAAVTRVRLIRVIPVLCLDLGFRVYSLPGTSCVSVCVCVRRFQPSTFVIGFHGTEPQKKPELSNVVKTVSTAAANQLVWTAGACQMGRQISGAPPSNSTPAGRADVRSGAVTRL